MLKIGTYDHLNIKNQAAPHSYQRETPQTMPMTSAKRRPFSLAGRLHFGIKRQSLGAFWGDVSVFVFNWQLHIQSQETEMHEQKYLIGSEHPAVQ